MIDHAQFNIVVNRMAREQGYVLGYETHLALLKVIGLIGETLPPNAEDIDTTSKNADTMAEAFVLLAALANMQDVADFEQKVMKHLIKRSVQMDGLE